MVVFLGLVTVEELQKVSDAEWGDVWVRVLQENARRETLRSARELAQKAAREYENAVSESVPKDVAEFEEGGVVGPGESVVIDGVEWLNASGTWLSPHTAGPQDYPMGWMKSGADAVAPGGGSVLWTVGLSVSAGDLVEHSGVVWKAIQGHTTQAGWEPGSVPALWARA
ncbi:carbohydrate-binding protein [Schaalia sp. ZJ1691]|uniref:carbohydrate-binding protein n=1 Tax=Schaalia sp. ZJ1691 TaxID=2709404 RepID=UPI0013EC13EB|nr:carbohydrate-binding protein [Schaalia sp. ZJ1691]